MVLGAQTGTPKGPKTRAQGRGLPGVEFGYSGRVGDHQVDGVRPQAGVGEREFDRPLQTGRPRHPGGRIEGRGEAWPVILPYGARPGRARPGSAASMTSTAPPSPGT